MKTASSDIGMLSKAALKIYTSQRYRFCLLEKTSCELLGRLYNISVFINRLLDHKSCEGVCDGEPNHVQGEVATRTDPPTKAKCFSRVRNIRIQLPVIVQESARVENMRIRVTGLIMKDCP